MNELSRLQVCLDALRKTSETAYQPPDSYPEKNYRQFVEDVRRLKQSSSVHIFELKDRLQKAKDVRQKLEVQLRPLVARLSAEENDPSLLDRFNALNSTGEKRVGKISLTPRCSRRLSPATSALAKRIYNKSTTTPRRMTLAGRISGITPLSLGRRVRTSNVSPFGARKIPATPLSRTGKRISRWRQSPRTTVAGCTPEMPTSRALKMPFKKAVVVSSLCRRVLDQEQIDVPNTHKSTPEMPTSSPAIVLKSALKSNTQRSALTDVGLEHRTAHVTEDCTPEMPTKKVVFFENPNVGAIHKRYVMIQDSTAYDATVILQRPSFVKDNADGSTPPLPTSLKLNDDRTAAGSADDITPPKPEALTANDRCISGQVAGTPSPPMLRTGTTSSTSWDTARSESSSNLNVQSAKLPSKESSALSSMSKAKPDGHERATSAQVSKYLTDDRTPEPPKKWTKHLMKENLLNRNPFSRKPVITEYTHSKVPLQGRNHIADVANHSYVAKGSTINLPCETATASVVGLCSMKEEPTEKSGKILRPSKMIKK